jgi:hypothetical protein
MPTAFTSLLGLALPVQGEETGQWGNLVNTSITSLVDTAIAGTTTISTDIDVTLTSSTGIADLARSAVILLSGARTAIRTITAPARSKVYVVINATTGGFATQFVGAGPTTGVTIPSGATTVVAWNGSDFLATTTEPVLSDKTISNATFTNGYTEESVVANSSTAYTILLSNGTVQFITMTGNCTFTFPTPSAGKSFSLSLKQDGTGSRLATWPGTVLWPFSVTPTLTTTANKTDRFVFTADGTNWFGAVAGQSY